MLALAAALGFGCQPEPDQASAAPVSRAQAVQTAAVKRIDTDRVYALSGVARAADRAQLAFQVGGRLVERPAAIGDQVAAGDLLARIEQPELGPAAAAARARAAQLKSELAQAQRDLARVQSLREQGAATEQELETAQSQRDSLAAARRRARAEAQRAQGMADELRLAAPVAGTVSQVFFEAGEFVPAGQPVIALSGRGGLEVEIGLPETLLDEVSIGDHADLSLPLVGGQAQGKVVELASAAGGPGALFPAVLALTEQPGLRAGVTVTWHLQSDEPQALSVPVAAIASTGGRGAARVFRVSGDEVAAVPVTLGAVVGERVMVSGELSEGERVVTLGLEGLVDGRKVAQ